MQALFSYTYTTSVGPVCINADATGIVTLSFEKETRPKETHPNGTASHALIEPAAILFKPTGITNLCADQIMEYLAGKRRYFDVPLSLSGSDFERQVWDALQNIPYASCATCTDIAEQLGNPDGYRAVSRAIGKNELPLLIPDHRIVDTLGKPLGTGNLAKRRQAFLSFERAQAGLA